MRQTIINSYVDSLSMEETLEKIDNIILTGRPAQHTVINAHKINLMEKDEELRRIVNSCPIINADGASIILASKIMGSPLKERVAGIDLFLNLLSLSEKRGYRIFLLGAREDSVVKAKSKIIESHPRIQIAGYHNGYFDQQEEPEIVDQISRSNSDILFVAFSSPMKERWINRNLSRLNVSFAMGVGGSFDVVAGITSRAPKWAQRMGLEWLVRLVQEPRRLWKRYLIGNIKFLWLTAKSAAKVRRKPYLNAEEKNETY